MDERRFARGGRGKRQETRRLTGMKGI